MFNGKKSKRAVGRFQWKGVLVTALVFLGMILVLVSALSQVDQSSGEEQAKILRDAVLRATLTCYAVEGRYPPNVAYLEEHYGIVYDDRVFIVVMDAFSSNLLPTIQVLTQGGGAYES